MTKDEQIHLIATNPAKWNQWRKAHLEPIDLSGARLSGLNLPQIDLAGVNLRSADLSNANLSGAHFMESELLQASFAGATLDWANFYGAQAHDVNFHGASLENTRFDEARLTLTDFSQATLTSAALYGANLSASNLTGANLVKATLAFANLTDANLDNADASNAILHGSILVKTKMDGTVLNGANIYGASVWGISTSADTEMRDLVITEMGHPTVTVDNLKIAQFIHLMLSNSDIRDVIDSITSKVVLILGRFSPERKLVLDAIREELRRRNYTPVIFDFETPNSRDVDETVNLLARMSRFVIADATDPRSLPQELTGFVGANPSIPVQFLLLKGESEWGMKSHFESYPWVLPTHEYTDADELIASIHKSVIEPVEAFFDRV